MPLYDYECPYCGHKFEEMAAVSENEIRCENCDGMAKRTFAANLNWRSDAAWVSDCTVAFDPEDSRPDVQAYLANPSDKTALYRACQAAGIRHLEEGEGRSPRRDGGIPEGVIRELVGRHKYRMGML